MRSISCHQIHQPAKHQRQPHRFDPAVQTGQHEQANQGEQGAENRLGEAGQALERFRPTAQRPARPIGEGDDGQRDTGAKADEGQDGRGEIFTVAGSGNCRAQRWTHARCPDQPEQKTNQELACTAARVRTRQQLRDAVRCRAFRSTKSRLERRNQQDDTRQEK